MRKESFFIKKMLPVAVALATAWAARGQIGHEYGAAWAAAIGILTVIIVSGRQDWYNRFPVIVALGAIAWGSGGMISYGQVVGYGFAPDYINTSYGLVMLMVIGSLYGFLGGGITGLAMESTVVHKPDWAALVTQMFAGGFLFWGFFIYQLGWTMTPPRSELWAASMGAALALGWYLYRHGYSNALRTAFFGALGAGFGFGFGNFLQRMGSASGILFNWWNVMEYSIGFFGGLGMAYGIFKNGTWPISMPANSLSNRFGGIFLILLLPMICLIKGVNTETLMRFGNDLKVTDPAAFALTWQWVAWGISIVGMFLLWQFFRPSWGKENRVSKKTILMTTLSYLTWYILISNLINAIWLTPQFSSQHLYWLNLGLLILLLRGPMLMMTPSEGLGGIPYTRQLLKWWVVAFGCILICSYVAISTHYAHSSAHLRFE